VKKLNDFKAALSDKAFCEDPLSIWEQEGMVAIGAYGSITTYYDNETDDMKEIFSILQEHMEDDQVIIMQESGYEKLRYVTGFAWVITKDTIDFIDVLDVAIKRAERIRDGYQANDLVPHY
jgi:hypothetical protein